MIKVVLSAIPVYLMSYMKLPKAIEEGLIHLMRRFLWNGSSDFQKFPLLAWDKICKPQGVKGVGVKQLHLMNLAMGAKLVWYIYCKGVSAGFRF